MSAIAVVHRLRPAEPADEPIRRTVFRSTRADELTAIGWPNAMIDTFCDQQYDARAVGYAQTYPSAAHSIIVDTDGVGIGELIIDDRSASTVIVNVALLPSHRGYGIGTMLLEQVLDRADGLGRTVELTVDRTNRARTLYERLGFAIVDTDELHHRMRRDTVRKEPA